MHSGNWFPVLQSRRPRGPEGPALEFTLKVSARTGLSCMNRFGTLLILIWGTANRDALEGGAPFQTKKLVPAPKVVPEVPGR
jgi:hypothetical protein